MSSTIKYSYLVSNACYLLPLVPAVYYIVTVVYYPALGLYYSVLIACTISNLPYIYKGS